MVKLRHTKQTVPMFWAILSRQHMIRLSMVGCGLTGLVGVSVQVSYISSPFQPSVTSLGPIHSHSLAPLVYLFNASSAPLQTTSYVDRGWQSGGNDLLQSSESVFTEFVSNSHNVLVFPLYDTPFSLGKMSALTNVLSNIQNFTHFHGKYNVNVSKLGLTNCV